MKRPKPLPLRSDETVVIGTATDEALFAELRDSFAGAVDKVPSGHLTCEQWAERWGKSASYTRRLLLHGLRRGTWGSVKHRVEMPTRGIFPVPHYFKKAK